MSVLCVMLICSVAGMAVAAANGLTQTEECMSIVVGQSKVVKAPWPAVRVAVTDPKVANVQLLTPDQVLVQGNKVGATDLILWNADETKVWRSCVYITLDVEQYQQKLHGMFPRSMLQLEQSGDVLVIRGLLRGADEVTQLHNFLDKTGVKYADMSSVAGTQQVQLEVRVAEVSLTAIRELTVNTSVSSTDDFFGITPGSASRGSLIPGLGPDDTTTAATSSASGTFFARFDIGGTTLRTFIQALAENQYLRILANPTLVARSGEEASFLAGGEYPIPVVQGSSGGTGGGNAVTIEYKSYGVMLSFRPIVLGDGTIQLYVAPEVSDLTDVGSVTIEGFQVPALLTRSFETTLELKSGQTFAMAGLIKRNVSAINSRLPGLGDLPVIGTLFRSVRFENGETEMVVLVTASLVEPMNLANVPPLPGFLDTIPKDWEFYIDGRLTGKEPAKISASDAEWLKEKGIDKLFGPGAWDSYANPAAPSQAKADEVTQ